MKGSDQFAQKVFGNFANKFENYFCCMPRRKIVIKQEKVCLSCECVVLIKCSLFCFILGGGGTCTVRPEHTLNLGYRAFVGGEIS